MIKSSFPKVADQILSFNKNLIDTLSKIDRLTTTEDSTISTQVYDEEGVLREYNLPSFSSLKSDIDRLNNNINSLYSIDADGSLIQQSNSNKFKKIITVDLNRDPNPINSLGEVSRFKSKVNWFFDTMLDPMMQVEFDLSDKIDNNSGKSLVRRYIVDFEKDTNGTTNRGKSAMNSFNKLFRGNSNITFSEFENWHNTTPGVKSPTSPTYDEDIYELEPNKTLYDGEFSVLSIQEDKLNRKLWYVLNSIDYVVSETNESKELTRGDEVIVNSENTSTRYKILEVSKSESNPRVTVERLEGLEAIKVGINTLKIYSPVIYSKNLRVNIGYNERSVLFIKPINTNNNITAKKWSLGVGFYTNDLRFSSNNEDDGLTMEQYYTDYVYDYGVYLKDMVSKKLPNKLGAIPNSPKVDSSNFKVVQVNKHLTDTMDLKAIKKDHSQQNTLKSEIRQIDDSILNRNKKIKTSSFNSESEKRKSKMEIEELSSKKESKAKLLSTITKKIIDTARVGDKKSKPKYKLRGFWNFPDAVSVKGSVPQEVIQFKIQYRYTNINGTSTSIEQYDLDNKKASFSNWNEITTDVRKRIYDSDEDEYYWQIEDVENSETPNINQLDITINPGEKVEFRVKSISEVGWPESPLESKWSPITSINFPPNLENVINENEFILREADKEDMKIQIDNDLKAKGLFNHLSDTIVNDNETYHHHSNKILSGFKDKNGSMMPLYDYLRSLEDKIKSLEEKLSKSLGILEVFILRNNEEYKVGNGSESVFNIDCENYLDKFSGTNVPSGRVYENNIYSIKDFVIRIKNGASDSPLGLLSDKNYLQNNNIYNGGAPQTFWVNDQDELLKSDVTSRTRTQLNNQFIWMVNYDSVTDNTVSKLSENIGNLFAKEDSNSITDVLSSPEYNVGFSETSLLSFVGNNNSLLDTDKWIDTSTSIGSTTKLLTTIHPVVKDLESIVENNSDKVKSIEPGDDNDIIVPINIYFKMNSLDPNQTGANYEYVDLNKSKKVVQHSKKVKFLLENESENRSFTFSIKFNMNRSNTIVRKSITAVNQNIK